MFFESQPSLSLVSEHFTEHCSDYDLWCIRYGLINTGRRQPVLQ